MQIQFKNREGIRLEPEDALKDLLIKAIVHDVSLDQAPANMKYLGIGVWELYDIKTLTDIYYQLSGIKIVWGKK